MRRLMLGLSLGTLVFGLMGCITRGQNFSSDTKWIDETKPHQTDVKKVMGQPFQVGSSSGVPTWTYGYYKYRLFGESEVKELKFYWSKEGGLKSYSFSSSFPQDVERRMR